MSVLEALFNASNAPNSSFEVYSLKLRLEIFSIFEFLGLFIGLTSKIGNLIMILCKCGTRLLFGHCETDFC